MTLVTDPGYLTSSPALTLTPTPTSPFSSRTPSPTPKRPHRRLYTHHHHPHYPPPRPASTTPSLSIHDSPLMLLPRARLHDDNDDPLRRRSHTVVPDNGLEKLQLSAISATSGWIGVEGGGGERGWRPLTVYDLNSARSRRLRKERPGAKTAESAVNVNEAWGDPRSSPHFLTTRRGKMALLRERTRSHTALSDRSASADSGLGSPSTLDKTAHDVSSSDVFDDVTRFSSTETLALSRQASFGNTSSGGFFGAYVTKHALTHDKTNETSRDGGALITLSDEDSALVSDDAFPEHLDSFEDVTLALVDKLRREKRKEEKEGGEVDDVFDERWHRGHVDGDDCPYCREFSRATKRRVDRYFGGTESFLSWIFSKWGKRKELEGTFRRSVGTRGRSPHFCNFVHKADLHTRYDSGHARTGSGNDLDDGKDSLSSEATDGDILAQWRKSRHTNSGTEGRPGSPTSLDGRSRDPNATSAQNNGASEDEDTLSATHAWNWKPPSRKTHKEKNRKGAKGNAKPIPTITIPSTPLPSGDQTLSNRSSGESSPRKSAREEPKPPDTSAEKSPKPQHLDVSVPTPPPKEEKKAEKGKRLPVSKKTRKAGDRRRKSKTVTMDPVPVEISASGEPAASGDAKSQPTTNGVDVNAKVPDLPETPTPGKKAGKHGKKGQRRLIPSPPVGGEKLQLPQELLDLDSNSRTGYDFGDLETSLPDNNNKLRPQSWLNTRMALSQQASRFELPMDMKVLEQITPQDYLKKFCVVTSRRLTLYQKIFNRHKDKTQTINKQGLEMCLKETLVQQMKDSTFVDLCDLLDITEDTIIDFKLFAGAAAITERILYPHYTTEDTLEKPEYQRERIETADFGALDWKLHGIQIDPKMKKLLKTIE